MFSWRPSKKTIAILVGILVLLLILWLLWPRKKDPQTVPLSGENKEESVPSPQFAPAETRTASTPVQASVEIVARTFAERYASFSSESSFANVRDLFSLMTTSFASKEQARISAATSVETSYGVSSKTITVYTESLEVEKAIVNVGLQQIVSFDTGETKTEYKTAQVTLVKTSAGWLVNAISFLK